jgi:hypothetical protein
MCSSWGMKWRNFLFLLFLQTIRFPLINSNPCQLYLAPSLLPHAGYGIFSGVDLKPKTLIRREPTALIDNLLLEEYQLSNYFYASHYGDSAVCAFGISMMLNHLETPNLERQWSSSQNIYDIQSISLRPYTTYAEFDFITNRNIQIGEELFTKYGSSQWFLERNIPYDRNLRPTSPYSLSELQRVGHCLDHVKIGDSTIPMAGRGLFAHKTFVKGELVTISPLLVAPLHQIKKEGASSLLINYFITSLASDFALLPIGHVALANHGGKDSNLRMEWYDTKEWNQKIDISSFDSIANRDRIFEHLNASMILDSPSGNLYLGYYATRDIEIGEELTIDYGLAWEVAYYRYLETMNDWFSKNNQVNIITAPQFRQPITMKWGFFPDIMRKSCVGKGCSSISRVDQFVSLHQKLNELSPSYQFTQQTLQQSQQYMKQLMGSSMNDKKSSPTCANNGDTEGWTFSGAVNKLKGFFGGSC